MIKSLLPTNISNLISSNAPLETITEIRLRIGKNLLIKTAKEYILLDYKVVEEELKHVIRIATHNSLYAFQDQIKMGYISYNGIRIGLVGSVVMDKDKIITIKEFTSLIIRIPHEIVGCSDSLNIVLPTFENTLIVSPPYGGKTTLIRDLARRLSKHYDTLLIDERGEIHNNSFSFGERLDVFKDAPKSFVIEGVIRATSPEIIVMDELFNTCDMSVIREITRSGIKVLASIHGDNVSMIKNVYPELTKYFTNVIELSNKPKVGTIKSILRLK